MCVCAFGCLFSGVEGEEGLDQTRAEEVKHVQRQRACRTKDVCVRVSARVCVRVRNLHLVLELFCFLRFAVCGLDLYSLVSSRLRLIKVCVCVCVSRKYPGAGVGWVPGGGGCGPPAPAGAGRRAPRAPLLPSWEM